MSNYPYGTPSSGIGDGIYTSDFSPEATVAGIVDNFTAVNKNGMKASVGYQLSKMQNYVNQARLGLEDVPVNSGYITNVFAGNNGSVKIDNSHYDVGANSYAYLYNSLTPTSNNVYYQSGVIVGTEYDREQHTLNTNSLEFESQTHLNNQRTLTISNDGTIVGSSVDITLSANGSNWDGTQSSISMYSPNGISGFCHGGIQFTETTNDIDLNAYSSDINLTTLSQDINLISANDVNISGNGDITLSAEAAGGNLRLDSVDIRLTATDDVIIAATSNWQMDASSATNTSTLGAVAGISMYSTTDDIGISAGTDLNLTVNNASGGGNLKITGLPTGAGSEPGTIAIGDIWIDTSAGNVLKIKTS